MKVSKTQKRREEFFKFLGWKEVILTEHLKVWKNPCKTEYISHGMYFPILPKITLDLIHKAVLKLRRLKDTTPYFSYRFELKNMYNNKNYLTQIQLTDAPVGKRLKAILKAIGKWN